MKKRLQVFVLALATMAFGTTKAQLTICFTDALGFNYFVEATNTGFKSWSIGGAIDLGTGTPWDITGSYDMMAGEFEMFWTNPSPDGCTEFVDALEFWATSGSAASGLMDWNYYQICDGTPLSDPFPYPVAYSSVGCPAAPARTAMTNIAMVDNDNMEEGIRNFLATGGMTFNEIFTVRELHASPMGNGMVFSSNKTIESGSELTIYNHVGQVINTAYAGADNMVIWDGTSMSGVTAESGMYIAVLRNGTEMTSTKFIK
jgi:hypothetical protein